MSALSMVPAGRTVTSAQPYHWPYHGAFDPSRCALVACLDGTWRAGGPASKASDALLVSLAGALRAQGALIVAITATPRRSSGPPPPATAPAPDLAAALQADVELVAGAASAFYASALDELLRANERSDLVLAGWGLEGPVHSTMRAANDRGYECLLVPDASVPVRPELVFAAGEMVRFSGGIFGAVADTAGVVRCLADAPPTRSTP